MTQIPLSDHLKEAVELIEFAARAKVHCELQLDDLVKQCNHLDEAQELLNGRIRTANEKIDKATETLKLAIMNLLRINKQ